MIEDNFFEDLSPYQKELSSRIFDLVISRILRTAYNSFDEKTKDEMKKVFDSDDEKAKQDFVKNNIPDLDEKIKIEMQKVEDDIKSEVENRI